MTWLFPALAALSSRGTNTRSGRARRLTSLTILIPAHNEEKNLRRTLLSIQRAIDAAKKVFPALRIMVRVGSDGSTDRTRQVARSMGASVVSFPPRGKWGTLLALVKMSAPDSDWLALADAGVLWPEDFLVRALPLCREQGAMAVAPTYRSPEAGRIEALIWSVERHFKSLESSLGGPVSIHGATVLYRSAELAEALRLLEGKTGWLNDDVVLPLMLRARFPSRRITYASDLGVFDGPEEQGAGRRATNDFKRRRRLVLGNIQWIRTLLPGIARVNPATALLAMRRVSRVLWAYWGLALAACAALIVARASFTLFCLLSLAGLFAGVLFYRAMARIAASAAASLAAPYYLFSIERLGRSAWK